jgi:hypothetical protein
VGAAAVAAAVLQAERLMLVVGVFGAAAVVVLAVGIAARQAAGIGVGVAGLGACWAVSAWTRGAEAPDLTVVVVVAVFVAAEVAFMSLEQKPVPDEGELVARRLAGLAGRSVVVLVLAAILLAALGLHATGGLLLEAVGVAAAIGVLLLVFALARREHASAER